MPTLRIHPKPEALAVTPLRISVQQLAQRVPYSVRFITGEIAAGRLRATKGRGNKHLITVEAAEAWVAAMEAELTTSRPTRRQRSETDFRILGPHPGDRPRRVSGEGVGLSTMLWSKANNG